MKTRRLFALGSKSAIPVAVNGLTPIGGAGSSGIEIEGLKHKGDYAILGLQPDGIAIHSLRSRQSAPHILSAGEGLKIDDLALFVVPDEDVKEEWESLPGILGKLSSEHDAGSPLEDVLNELLHTTKLEKGLIITKNVSGTYEILVSRNIDKNEAWLSESLIQKALSEKKPTLVQNIVGTAFDTKASLVATGFLSVFCWPLLVQGQTVGLMIAGSKRPHSGLSERESKLCETYVSVAALVAHFRLKELGLKRLIKELEAKRGDIPLLTDNERLKETCELARKVAASDLSVLVQGETGVGKEVLSRWIHDQSDRKRGPFVAINCSAIPRDLLESVLFGHRKGSFTGAHTDQVGKIQQADSGTLFLDEIGDLPLELQAKLLRVLQDKMIEPVGASKAVRADIRVISATHKSVQELVREGRFREDLYYRIAEMTLWIPPLRERPADIRLLANQFLKELSPTKRLSGDALSWLIDQPWRGNTRELKSAIKRACLLSTGDEVEIAHFTWGAEFAAQSPSGSKRVSTEKNWLGGETLEDAKHAFVHTKIQQALERTHGNRTRAAELLGVTPRTLFRYLEDETP